MTKRLILFIILSALAVPAQAAVSFVGALVVTAATAGCQSWAKGDTRISKYQPFIAGGQDMLLFELSTYAGVAYSLSAPLTAAFQPAVASFVNASLGVWNGSQIRVSSQVPTTIVGATRYVFLRGQIKNPAHDAGGNSCTITFEGAYVRE